ncbi:MAG: glycosyltransferase [Ruminococcus sp.]
MKILILTASTGGGHKVAAAALKDTIEKADSSVQVEIEDGLKYCGNIYNKFICGGYLVLATKTPGLYGKLYNKSDKKSKLNSICNHVNAREGFKLVSLFEKVKPDVVISCHAFITTMLSKLKLKKIIDVPVISLITDFSPHRTYFFKGIEAYITSDENMTEEITGYGIIQKERIYPYGIPIFDKFYRETSKEKTAQELNFSLDIPTVLLMAGSFGVTEVLAVYESFMHTDIECQCIVITGNNQKLYDAFEKYLGDSNRPHKPTKLFKFINNVEEYMHFSDLIVTKPGGLTVTESLACNLPLAIYNAIPGQENENAEYLKNSQVAIILDKQPEIGGKEIAALLSDKAKLKQMQENCKKISKRDSALNIFRLAKEFSKNKN